MARTYTDSELKSMKPENRPKIVYNGVEYDDDKAGREIDYTILEKSSE